MDITNWGIGRIMQLPDHLFGRKYVIGCGGILSGAGNIFPISSVALPEWTVIWELRVWGYFSASGLHGIKFALGDQVPADADSFLRFEQLFADVGYGAGTPKDLYLDLNGSINITGLRMPVHTAGRRLVMEMTNIGAETILINSAMIISGIPREIPEWMLSAKV